MAKISQSPALTDTQLFDLRWDRGLPDITGPLKRLYGPDVAPLLARLRDMLQTHAAQRSPALKQLDLIRDLNPNWFLSSDMVGYVFYIDRFAGGVKDIPKHIPYLRDLGVTYAHMMPCLRPRPSPSDGGYAVMNYREINPDLGTMDEFEATCTALREAGISPCIDMVLNHTAAEHDWAQKARAGDPFFQDFYLMFPDRTEPDKYEQSLLEIFPDQAPGNFTFDEASGKWVWTTFNTFQWDLNWANPEVFLAILDTMLHLAGKGVEVLRLDAVAFMAKKVGTTCQNLPPVHDILQALAQSMRIAAPAVIHKAEAIVAPDQLVPYLGTGSHAGKSSHLAYQNSLMVQYWSSLAARDTRLMTHVMKTHFPPKFDRAGWATYIRCHDDIGWAITEEDTAQVHPMTGPGHRAFLADFYNGSYSMSFALGADFQVNEDTGDRRTNGTFASLAGLEAALERKDKAQIDLSLKRILMGQALIASFGGLPLLYMGDELGMLNDHSYLENPARAHDGRWMQRPMMDWAATRKKTGPAATLLKGVRHIMATRKATPQLAGTMPTHVKDVANPALFIFERRADDLPVTCIFNFTEEAQAVTPWSLGLSPKADYQDRLTGKALRLTNGQIPLPAYAAMWLRATT